MSKRRIVIFMILGLLSAGLGLTYLFGVYGPTEREVGTWGLIETLIGFLIIVLASTTVKNKLMKILLIVTLVINTILQILPTILWFIFHGSGISDGTPSSDFIAKWFYSIPHIIVGLLSIFVIFVVLKRSIEISRPKIEDIELINEFFEIVIRDTFKKNGIADLVDTIDEEIKDKRRFLNQDIESDGKNRYFLIAKEEGKIVGSVEYGPSNELITSCTNGELKELVEIGTVYVHPDYQNKGIGSRMLNLIFIELEKNGIKEFCFDSGYKTAQKIWISKFGKPEYHLKNYWGEDADHMVWRISVKDVLK